MRSKFDCQYFISSECRLLNIISFHQITSGADEVYNSEIPRRRRLSIHRSIAEDAPSYCPSTITLIKIELYCNRTSFLDIRAIRSVAVARSSSERDRRTNKSNSVWDKNQLKSSLTWQLGSVCHRARNNGYNYRLVLNLQILSAACHVLQTYVVHQQTNSSAAHHLHFPCQRPYPIQFLLMCLPHRIIIRSLTTCLKDEVIGHWLRSIEPSKQPFQI